jgi:ubiquinone/menaquinone biosynthesis C-methylase UbiE
MVVNNIVYANEGGLPLNAVEWLVTHHESKLQEREQMVRDLALAQGSLVVDAGCGPGLWTPLLAEAIGPEGRIIGVDISLEALVTAQKRCCHAPYRYQVQYRRAALEQLPLEPGSADCIFSANVSQYLAQPVETFSAMGRYLVPGGQLIVKDIDFGTMYFSHIDQGLQERVFQARQRWEKERHMHGLSFEDSWIGAKLADYLRTAGYRDIQTHAYRVVRQAPLMANFATYLRGIAEWFVCEDAPYLSAQDVAEWLRCFFSVEENVLMMDGFTYEETEYVVTGVWQAPVQRSYFDISNHC